MVQTNPEEFKIQQLSDSEFDLSDTRILRKTFPPKNITISGLLNILCNYEQKPQLPFESNGRAGFPSNFDPDVALLKNYSWNVYLKLCQLSQSDIVIGKINVLPNAINEPFKKIEWIQPKHQKYPTSTIN